MGQEGQGGLGSGLLFTAVKYFGASYFQVPAELSKAFPTAFQPLSPSSPAGLLLPSPSTPPGPPAPAFSSHPSRPPSPSYSSLPSPCPSPWSSLRDPLRSPPPSSLPGGPCLPPRTTRTTSPRGDSSACLGEPRSESIVLHSLAMLTIAAPSRTLLCLVLLHLPTPPFK